MDDGVRLTPHGIVMAIDAEIGNILNALSVLDRERFNIDNPELDIHVLSSLYFHRCLISIRLTYCLQKVNEIIKSLQSHSKDIVDPKSFEFCTIAAVKIKEYHEDNDKKMKIISDKLNNDIPLVSQKGLLH